LSTTRIERREVPADLIEATPGALGMWVLASPLLIFVLWMWVDLFAHYSPIPWYWVDAAIGAAFFVGIIVLPLGWLAHRLVTSAPRPFQHAGWDIQPLEPVSEQEMYLVRYRYQERHRASNTWQRQWLRAAQGWVYIEITVILLGGILIIPLFLSAVDFGFGR
jgi:hypothetical protein